MLRHKAYKFRIYPNKEQEVLITKTIGCTRFVYNHFLNVWNEAYASTGKGLSYHACSAMLPIMKQSEEWYGREIIQVDKWFASSQICSACGHKDGKKALIIRAWTVLFAIYSMTVISTPAKIFWLKV